MTTNPRVTILCAVSEIREFHGGDAFLMAVGDWLEWQVKFFDRSVEPFIRNGRTLPALDAVYPHALATARAFLADQPDNVDGSANTCRHDSATGIDTTPYNDPAKVWRCDHCGLRWTTGATS